MMPTASLPLQIRDDANKRTTNDRASEAPFDGQGCDTTVFTLVSQSLELPPLMMFPVPTSDWNSHDLVNHTLQTDTTTPL